MINKLRKIILVTATVLCVPLNSAQTSDTSNGGWEEEYGPEQVYDASRLDSCCYACICACACVCAPPIIAAKISIDGCADLLAASRKVVQDKCRTQPQGQKMD